MGFNCGIVGLPNVGKSALFNALTATQAAETTKYAFSTRDANIGRVAVPDERLAVCARLAKSAKIIPTQLEFVDIAGLVRGASKGQGLGRASLRASFTGTEVRVTVPDAAIAAIFEAAIAETMRSRSTDRLIRIVID